VLPKKEQLRALGLGVISIELCNLQPRAEQVYACSTINFLFLWNRNKTNCWPLAHQQSANNQKRSGYVTHLSLSFSKGKNQTARAAVNIEVYCDQMIF
jgi:hypothetical protein